MEPYRQTRLSADEGKMEPYQQTRLSADEHLYRQTFLSTIGRHGCLRIKEVINI